MKIKISASHKFASHVIKRAVDTSFRGELLRGKKKKEMTTRSMNELYLFACRTNSKILATKYGYKSAAQGFNIQNAYEMGYNIGLTLEPSGLIEIDETEMAHDDFALSAFKRQ